MLTLKFPGYVLGGVSKFCPLFVGRARIQSDEQGRTPLVTVSQ